MGMSVEHPEARSKFSHALKECEQLIKPDTTSYNNATQISATTNAVRTRCKGALTKQEQLGSAASSTSGNSIGRQTPLGLLRDAGRKHSPTHVKTGTLKDDVRYKALLLINSEIWPSSLRRSGRCPRVSNL